MGQLYTSVAVCDEIADSPREEWGEKGLVATVHLKVPWDYRTLVVGDIVGNMQLYPRIPASMARAKTASVLPFQSGQQQMLGSYVDACDYEYADITIRYEAGGPESEELFSEELTPTAEFLTLDPKNFFWDAAKKKPLKEGEAPGKLIRGLEYTVTQYKVLALPVAILTLPGTCNASAYMARILGLTFPAETLLYNPPKCTRKISSNATDPPSWTVAHSLLYKASTWNKFWNPATGSFDQIYDKNGNVYKNHPTANFSGVLP